MELDLATWMTRASLEVIGQSGLGYSFEPLTEEGESHPYSICVKEIVPMTMRPAVFIAKQLFLPTLIKLDLPRLWEKLIDIVPWKSIHEIRDTCNLMHRTACEIYEWKKEMMKVDEGGNGVLSILMQENTKEKSKDAMSEKEILAQISSIAFAATETTSGAICRILHLLALNTEVQERLRKEIGTANEGNDGPPDYDTLSALPYLDDVYRETLRLYPPLITMGRLVLRDTVLPLSKPVKATNGQLITEIPLSKGSQVLIPLVNCNCDATLWVSDAEEWKPERWLSPLPVELIEAKIPGVYSHLMTFPGGARSCIGVKFVQIEIKVMIAIMLQRFTFSPSNKRIEWHVGTVATPVVVGEEPHPQLPLIVGRIGS